MFYEIGVAQALAKPVIFLTQDAPENAPVDIRQFEFIKYELSRHTDFLANLDNAIQNVFVGKYAALYEKATLALRELIQFSGVVHEAASLSDFQGRVMRAERREAISDSPTEEQLLEFLLPKIIADVADVQTMRKISEWLGQKFPREL